MMLTLLSTDTIYTNPMQRLVLLQVSQLFLQHRLEAERLERNTVAHEMFAHCLNPVQSERVQHSRSTFHDDQDGDSEEEPDTEEEEDDKRTSDACETKGNLESHGPEHNGKLLVRKRKSPETEVGCRVGDTVEAEFCEMLVVVKCRRYS